MSFCPLLLLLQALNFKSLNYFLLSYFLTLKKLLFLTTFSLKTNKKELFQLQTDSIVIFFLFKDCTPTGVASSEWSLAHPWGATTNPPTPSQRFNARESTWKRRGPSQLYNILFPYILFRINKYRSWAPCPWLAANCLFGLLFARWCNISAALAEGVVVFVCFPPGLVIRLRLRLRLLLDGGQTLSDIPNGANRIGGASKILCEVRSWQLACQGGGKGVAPQQKPKRLMSFLQWKKK